MANEPSPTETSSLVDKKTPTPIIPILNSLLILGVAGFIYYSNYLYKPIQITETSEKEKLKALHAKKTLLTDATYIEFEPITINIKPITINKVGLENHSHAAQGKLHYVTLKMALQIQNETYKEDIERKLYPLIMDRVISRLGKKQFHELINIQGRYILQTELIEELNELITQQLKLTLSEGIISQLYFTQFIVQ